MWHEALSMLDRADRLQRQFSTHVVNAWEPPIDVVETGEYLRMQIALPGVSADAITIGVEPGGVTVSALRAFPCREPDMHIHRVEIPYGRFERHIALPLEDPYLPIELVEKVLADGVLTLTFRKKEAA
jgi:HSP20 family molecular chaperone IbpA